MKFGYWLPVFGGWLRNVDDEGMAASWEYSSRLARRSETIGFDLTLVAELNLNDIKGVEAPSLDAWSTAAALAAVTERLEIMVAVRPTFHPPALLAKQAANIDRISGGRLSLIGQFAQRVHPLSPAMRSYTAQVTRVWAGYFAAMTVASVVVYASLSFAAWSVLANLLTPVLVVGLFVGEFLLCYRLHPEFERTRLVDAVRAFYGASSDRAARR